MLRAALCALLCAAAPPLAARDFAIPAPRVERERPDPEFEQDPLREDFYSLTLHYWDCIADRQSPQNRVPGVDFFLENLEGSVARGIDVPLAEIALNADAAREALRLSFNDLAEAGSSAQLSEAVAELRAIHEESRALGERNEASVRALGRLADAARGTVGGMILEPPDSPGARVPVESLAGLDSIHEEVDALLARLKQLAKSFKKAKALVGRARERAALVAELGDRAGELDKRSTHHLAEGRTRGASRDYRSQLSSQRVIRNAQKRMLAAVGKAEEVLKRLDEQLDPAKEGTRRAVDALHRADRRTMLGKEISRQSAMRINWNHTMRMNDSIKNGYEAAPDSRRPWWVGRSNMAISEARVDSGKLDAARDAAAGRAAAAERALASAQATLEELARALGDFDARPKALARRPLDIPPVRDPGGERKAVPRKQVKSQKIKIPRTFNVSNEEIVGSYDNRPF